MRYIQSFSTSGAVQDALDNGLLGKPYVAYVEDGSEIDWNTLTPAHPVPQVETRMKVTYHMDQPGEFTLITYPTDESLVSVEIGGEVIALGPDYEGETNPTYTASTAGDYVAYFTFSGDTIGDGNQELFVTWDTATTVPIIAIEIPANLPNIYNNALMGVGGDNGILSAVTLPDVPLTIGPNAFRHNLKLQVVKTHSMSGSGYIYIPSGSSLDFEAFGEVGYYQEYEPEWVEHVLISAATFAPGVNFIDTAWEDEGSDRPQGYQFEMDKIVDITFLDTVPPTIQMNTFNWYENYNGVTCHAHVPSGYEQDYVDSFNYQIHDDEVDDSWYFGLGLPGEVHDCETGPTPGYIWADACGGNAECKCLIEWGEWDYEGEECHECGWEPDPCDEECDCNQESDYNWWDGETCHSCEEEWESLGYSSPEDCACSQRGNLCEEGE